MYTSLPGQEYSPQIVRLVHQKSRAQFAKPPVLLADKTVPGRQFEEHSEHQLGQHTDHHPEQHSARHLEQHSAEHFEQYSVFSIGERRTHS